MQRSAKALACAPTSKREINAQIAEREAEASDPFFAHNRAPIEDHVNDYEEFLAADGWNGKTTRAYRKKTRYRVLRVLNTAEIKHLNEIDAAKIDSALVQLKEKVRSEKISAPARREFGPATHEHPFAVRAFRRPALSYPASDPTRSCRPESSPGPHGTTG